MLRKFATLAPAFLVLAACGDDPTGTGAPPDIRPVADIVHNGLDATVDADAEVMALDVGGASGTTRLHVQPTNGDGKNGCNFSGPTPKLVVSVTSSAPAVATVSPTTLTFTSCGDTPTLTVTPVAQGTATISLSQVENNTGATFDLAPARFTVTVAPPTNTAPTVVVAGVTGGESYDKGSVPAATCRVTDAEDGNPTFAATLSAITGPYAADGIGSQTASCSYTDAGGLTASASATYSIVDPSAPAIGYTRNPTSPDGSDGWYRSDVTLTWDVREPESPGSLQKTGCENRSITDDQAETTYSCAATSAGGASGPVEVTIKRDATAPSISIDGGPADGGTYYFGSVPAAPSCTASDALSGVDGSCGVAGHGVTVGSHTLTFSARDKAGNTTTEERSYTVRAWTISGFYNPVDMDGIVNTVKGGSTVPLKFELFAGSELTATSAIRSFTTGEVSCAAISSAPTAEIEILSTGGTSLRYDATAGQFIQNWQTPKTSGRCYRATLVTQDGSSIHALFRTR